MGTGASSNSLDTLGSTRDHVNGTASASLFRFTKANNECTKNEINP